MKKILRLNEISKFANPIFENYEYGVGVENPDGIILRSFQMKDYEIGSNLIGVARAGAGVNNIPIADYANKGIVVFNTPGANANAVKELVICALFLASRKIVDGVNWVQSLKGQTDVAKLVEKGKSQFAGPEILGKTLGVIGLGAIGAKVANAASALGMTVLGNDPYLSVDAAWTLSRKVIHEKDRNKLFADSDYITLHVPFLPDTKDLINENTIAQMKDGVCIINCARGELVNNEAIIKALQSGKVARYVTDFPNEELIGVPNVVTIPHLGASTEEAEDNCAVMAAKQLVDFIEKGNIANSVNFPAVFAPPCAAHRLSIVHKNVANMISQATNLLGNLGININNLVSASRGDIAYMLIDTDVELDRETVKKISEVDGYIKVRVVY